MPFGAYLVPGALGSQTALAIPTPFPRSIGAIQATIIPDVSGAQAVNLVILTGVASGHGASGGQVSGAQFTVDPTQQEFIFGEAMLAGQTVYAIVYEDGDQPVNP